MVKKAYPIKWDSESGKWLLQYVTTNGAIQNVLSPEKVALENYLAEFEEFWKLSTQKSR